MLWRHGVLPVEWNWNWIVIIVKCYFIVFVVLPSNNARNSPLFGRGKFFFKCSFMCDRHCSDVCKSVILSSLQWIMRKKTANQKTRSSIEFIQFTRTSLPLFQRLPERSPLHLKPTHPDCWFHRPFATSDWDFYRFCSIYLPKMKMTQKNTFVKLSSIRFEQSLVYAGVYIKHMV